MKILIVIGICVCTTLIGKGFSNFYKKRKNFYENSLLMLEEFKNQINYKNITSIKFLETIQGRYGGDLIRIFKEYINLINDKKEINSNDLFKNIIILNDEEKNNYLIFFQSLGHMSTENQIENINNFKSLIEKDYKKTVEEYSKFSPMFTKLGILVGLAISLLII